MTLAEHCFAPLALPRIAQRAWLVAVCSGNANLLAHSANNTAFNPTAFRRDDSARISNFSESKWLTDRRRDLLPEERLDRDIQGMRDPRDVLERRIAEPKFNPAQICAVDAGFFCELLLREPLGLAALTHAEREITDRSVLEAQAS